LSVHPEAKLTTRTKLKKRTRDRGSNFIWCWCMYKCAAVTPLLLLLLLLSAHETRVEEEDCTRSGYDHAEEWNFNVNELLSLFFFSTRKSLPLTHRLMHHDMRSNCRKGNFRTIKENGLPPYFGKERLLSFSWDNIKYWKDKNETKE
jgi:hypothetical protein